MNDMKGFGIYVKNDLLDPKHIKGMGAAVWLYMWCIDKMTSIDEDGIGKILGGKPIKFEEVGDELGISIRTYRRWISILEKHEYINTKVAPYGLIVTVNKAFKRFGKRYAESGTPLRVPQTAHLTTKSGTPNKTQQLDKAIDIAAPKATAPFVLEEKLKEMEKNPNSHLDIIASFIREKPVPIANSKQLSNVIVRYCRTAKALSGAYTNEQIFGAASKIKKENQRRENSGDTVDWTLETVLKQLTK